jgi:DNA processing protein
MKTNLEAPPGPEPQPSPSTDEALLARIRLARTRGVGARRAKLLEERCGPPRELFCLGLEGLRALEVPPRIAHALVDPRYAELAHAELAEHRVAGHDLIALGCERYPEALAEIHDPPQVLSLRGTFEPEALRVAIVGARRGTPEGLEIAYELGLGLAAAGVVVVSGLARGIDTAAHEGALAAGGRTLAVLGSGLSRVYPRRNVGLAERITREGALISEFAPTTEPRRHTFPQRNRIVTGLSEAVVVVQAGPRSGALLSADFALQQGRELCAVPGSIREPLSQGTNELLRDGAHFVTCVQDVLDLVRGVEGPDEIPGRGDQPHEGHLQPAELSVLEALRAGVQTHDLPQRLGIPESVVQVALGRLELAGRIRATLTGYVA